MNDAIERNALLEVELDEKESLQAMVQRLKDEISGKKIFNIILLIIKCIYSIICISIIIKYLEKKNHFKYKCHKYYKYNIILHVRCLFVITNKLN